MFDPRLALGLFGRASSYSDSDSDFDSDSLWELISKRNDSVAENDSL